MVKVWPQKDRSRLATLTGSALTLPNESCKSVTFLNTTGSDVNFIVNSGDAFALPTSVGITLFVSNTNLITVNGTNAETLQYIISE